MQILVMLKIINNVGLTILNHHGYNKKMFDGRIARNVCRPLAYESGMPCKDLNFESILLVACEASVAKLKLHE